MKYSLSKGRVVSLPTLPAAAITNCDDCGACCRYEGLPPFAPMTNPADREIQERMSVAAMESICEYHTALRAGLVEDRMRMFGKPNPATDIPCLWYDAAAKRCKFYEDRPTACRTMIQPGDRACKATRKAFGI